MMQDRGILVGEDDDGRREARAAGARRCGARAVARNDGLASMTTGLNALSSSTMRSMSSSLHVLGSERSLR